MNTTDMSRIALIDEIAVVERAIQAEPLTVLLDGGSELNPALIELVLREYDAVRELGRLRTRAETEP